MKSSDRWKMVHCTFDIPVNTTYDSEYSPIEFISKLYKNLL